MWWESWIGCTARTRHSTAASAMNGTSFSSGSPLRGSSCLTPPRERRPAAIDYFLYWTKDKLCVYYNSAGSNRDRLYVVSSFNFSLSCSIRSYVLLSLIYHECFRITFKVWFFFCRAFACITVACSVELHHYSSTVSALLWVRTVKNQAAYHYNRQINMHGLRPRIPWQWSIDLWFNYTLPKQAINFCCTCTL